MTSICEQTNQVRDEVWRSYVNNKLVEKEAKALGLTVSAAEIAGEFYHFGIFFYQILILLSGKSISVHLTYVMCLVRPESRRASVVATDSFPQPADRCFR